MSKMSKEIDLLKKKLEMQNDQKKEKDIEKLTQDKITKTKK